MTVIPVVVGPFEVNGYVVSGAPGAAVVIDPGADADRILEVLDSRGLRPEAILLTHGHCDHVGAVHAILAVHPVPVHMHPDDAAWSFTPQNQLPPFYGPPGTPPEDLRPARDGDRIEAAGLAFEVVATPGHSPGGVCFRETATGGLFSGDTLFRGSVGRTDLPGGDGRVLAASLRRLRALPPETRVFPGHGPATTMADEIRTNPFLR
jgi:glyoxylase-like metal-dependent hydrolase (beta-lactamase superfamily II)